MGVIIVGCGVIGLFTAYFLRGKGYNITIVCRDIPGVSSKANAGIVTASFTPAPWPGFATLLRALVGLGGPLAVSFREILGIEGLDWALRAYRARGGRADVLKAMAYRSLALFHELLRELRGVSYRRGVLALFLRAHDAELHSKLHGGKVIGSDEVKSFGFDGLEAGVLAEDEIALDPMGLLKALRESLAECTFLDDMVVGIRERDERVEVVLGRGDIIRGDYVIVASGAWAPMLLRKLGVRIPIKPARGIATLLKTPKPPTAYPAILEDYGIVVSPIPEGFTRVTGFFELKGFNLEWSNRRLKWIEGVIWRHVPTLRGYRIESVETGFRPCTPDMIPIIGELPGHRGLYVAIGHCRLGVTLAPVTGEVISSMMTGVKPTLPDYVIESISPHRLIGSPR